jgi:hypothetical protein
MAGGGGAEMATTRSQVTTQPSYAGSAIALFAAVCAAGLTTTHPVQHTLVTVEALGVLLVLLSAGVRQRGHRLGGLSLLLVGGGVVGLTLGLSTVFPAGLVERGALLCGMLGPAVLLLGLYPFREGLTRHLTGLGIALLVSTVVVRGWLGGIGQLQLLAAVALTILAWDVSEQAVRLGRDVGRGTRSAVVSLAHTAGSLLVGLLGVTAAAGIYGVPPSKIPLVALALLLASALVLVLALFLGHLD